VSATQAVRRSLDAIEAWEPAVNAFTEVFADAARLRAAEVDAGHARGPLAGVPVAVKDTLWMAGARATRGSRAFAGFVPDTDAVAVARLRAAGAVIVGKTTNPELCFRGVSVCALFGVTPNPFDRGRAAGGSSGGSGAAVAYGAVPLALGSDGGGSIRIPASFCGVAGHKPTFGLVPVTPGFRGWESLSVVGPIGRTVAEVAAGLKAIAGYHPSDPGSLPDGAALLARPAPAVGELRIAASADLGHLPVEPAVRQAFTAAIDVMRGAGWRIEDACPEPLLSAPLWTAIAVAEGHAADAELLAERREQLEDDTARLIAAGEGVTARAYLDALEERAHFTRAWQTFFEVYDVLVTPMMQMTALEVGVLSPPSIDGRPVDQFFDDWCGICLPANLTGMPATTVPGGYDDGGLPIGLQFSAARASDHLTLAAAAAWEALFAPQRRDPSLG
jgi:Asp-tRNA(Asn)/Glu-tRNA(Gln) amidotransferase A subunit family amidase